MFLIHSLKNSRTRSAKRGIPKFLFINNYNSIAGRTVGYQKAFKAYPVITGKEVLP